MQIAYHIGVNCTDGEQLLRSLNRSAKPLAQLGTEVPPTARYRKQIRQVVEAQVNAPPPADARETILRGIFRDAPLPARMVLSNPNFIATPIKAVDDGQFYGNAAFKTAATRALFNQDELHFYIGLRNPATLLPALALAAQIADVQEYIGKLDPDSIGWSKVIKAMRDAAPDCPITAWYNEDTLLLWHDILRALGGHDTLAYEGHLDLAATLMPATGLERLQSFLKDHPPSSPAQERRVIGAFLSKFVPVTAVTEEIDVAGWTARKVNQMTESYVADLDTIRGMPGVTLLTP